MRRSNLLLRRKGEQTFTCIKRWRASNIIAIWKKPLAWLVLDALRMHALASSRKSAALKLPGELLRLDGIKQEPKRKQQRREIKGRATRDNSAP